MSGDLSRWNRAGLARLRYVDGNAVTYLDELRRSLAERFPQWAEIQPSSPPDEGEAERLQRLREQYAGPRGDLGTELARAFARACHLLTEHQNAYANEAYLGTAREWESLRRLAAMVDYRPRPPASASTWLAIEAPEGAAGTLKAGFGVVHNPADGGAPVVFETLTDLELDAGLNRLRPRGHDRSPAPLAGNVLAVQGEIAGVVGGVPLVLEDELTGALSAHLVAGARPVEGGLELTVVPELPAGFQAGHTRIHLAPKERLRVRGPAAAEQILGNAVDLTAAPASPPSPGQVLVADDGSGARHRRLLEVEDRRLILDEALGAVRPAATRIGPAQALTVQPQDEAQSGGEPSVLAAGDWSRLLDRFVAAPRHVGDGLVSFRVLRATYTPVTATTSGSHPGFTRLDLVREPSTGFPLSQAPDTLWVPPAAPGVWQLDAELARASTGSLSKVLEASGSLEAGAGDLAVVTALNGLAWARLHGATVEEGIATVEADGVWQEHEPTPFSLTQARLFTGFNTVARVRGWDNNPTPLAGRRVPLPTRPTALQAGRALLVEGGEKPVLTRVAGLETDGGESVLVLADPLPTGAALGSVSVAANLVEAGHGQTQAERVLGSGDATAARPSFILEEENVSFVPDAAFATGVRADLSLRVDGRPWTQVDRLDGSGPADAHYGVRITEDGTLEVTFGDGRNGRRLPSGSNNLRVRFRRGMGPLGNLPPASLTTPLAVHPLVGSVRQPLDAVGGAPSEGVSSIRRNAPARLRSLDRALSQEDFELLAAANARIAHARAFSLPPGAGRAGGVEVVAVPAGGGDLAPLKSELAAFLAARALPGVPLVISSHQSVGVRVEVRLRAVPEDRETISQRVSVALDRALGDLGLGQPLYRAALYRTVEGVTGVRSADCFVTEVVEPVEALGAVRVARGRDGVIQVVQPTPRQRVERRSIEVRVEETDP